MIATRKQKLLQHLSSSTESVPGYLHSPGSHAKLEKKHDVVLAPEASVFSFRWLREDRQRVRDLILEVALDRRQRPSISGKEVGSVKLKQQRYCVLRNSPGG